MNLAATSTRMADELVSLLRCKMIAEMSRISDDWKGDHVDSAALLLQITNQDVFAYYVNAKAAEQQPRSVAGDPLDEVVNHGCTLVSNRAVGWVSDPPIRT